MAVSCVFYVGYYSSYSYSGLNVSIVKSLASQNYLWLCSEYSIIPFIATSFYGNGVLNEATSFSVHGFLHSLYGKILTLPPRV